MLTSILLIASLAVAPGGLVSVRVLNADGGPAAGAVVTASGDGVTTESEADALGVADLPGGDRLRLRVLSRDGRSGFVARLHGVVPPDFDVTLHPLVRCRVEVRTAGGGPAAGVWVGTDPVSAGGSGGWSECDLTRTDAGGVAEVLFPLPREAERRAYGYCVFAVGPGGVDYAHVRSADRLERTPPPTSVSLTLSGSRPAGVLVEDRREVGRERPRVAVKGFRKPGAAVPLNGFAFMDVQSGLVSYAGGRLEVPFLPPWPGPFRAVNATPHSVGRVTGSVAAGGPPPTLRLSDVGRVRARFVTPAGRPAAGAFVRPLLPGGSGVAAATRAGDRGEYEGEFGPGVVVLAARSGDLRSGFLGPVDVAAARTTDLGDVTLRAAARVTGRLTNDRGEPWVGERVTAESVLRVGQGRAADRYRDRVSAVTDADGRYALMLPVGVHRLSGLGGRLSADVTAARPGEALTVDRKVMDPNRTLRVVVTEGGRAAAGATVRTTRGSLGPASGSFPRADAAGACEVRVAREPLLLYAASADGSAAAVVDVGGEERLAAVTLRPAATAVGRLVDADGRAAAAAAVFVNLVESAPTGGQTHMPVVVGRTDETGAFLLGGIPTGRPLSLSAPQNRVGGKTARPFRAEGPGLIDLGETVVTASER